MYSRMMVAAVSVLSASVAAAEDRRALSAHEHGQSVLNIAIEGDLIAMELMSPGMDIVGFEHPATTDEQKAAIKQAETKLADPLKLFVMPAEAGCAVETAAVDLETDDHEEHAEDHGHAHEHEEDEDHAEHEGEEHEEHAEEHEHADEHGEHDDHAEHEGEEASHTEFQVAYALNCTSPDDLSGIEFAFFKEFPNAQEIDVTVITENGQTSYEVERDAPRIDLKGLI